VKDVVVKRALAGLFAVVLLSAGIVVSEPPGSAQATVPATLSVDCTNENSIRTSLKAIADNPANAHVKQFPAGDVTPDTVWVLSGLLVGDTRLLANSASTAGNCVVDQGAGLTSDETASQGGSPVTLTVANSGAFTITSSTGGAAITVYIDTCSLDGSGISQDPWLVGTKGDLSIVGLASTTPGENSCLLSGHYRQTANISDFDSRDNHTLSSSSLIFTGVYDGDHWRITHKPNSDSFESRRGVFRIVGAGGVIKKLRVDGFLKSDTTEVSGVVTELRGGSISEVKSTVNIEVKDSDALIGGIVALSGVADSLIQYSSYVGSIEWYDGGSRVEGPSIGGLVGQAQPDGEDDRTLTIRDSYARANITYNSGHIDNIAGTYVYAGGLVGVDGEVSGSISGGTFNRTDRPSNLQLIRSYAAGSFANSCVGDDTVCRTAKISTGGLVGHSTSNTAGDVYVGNYWLSGVGERAIGTIGVISGSSTDPLPAYTTLSGQSVPVAVPVSSPVLRTLSTFQSLESEDDPNQPSGSADISLDYTGDSSSLFEADYRWAIEQGNVETFVAQKRTASPAKVGETVTFTRAFDRLLWATSPVPAASYTTRGSTATLAEDSYPDLGRVWEICSQENNGYPVLVWEERTCSDGAGGGRDRNRTTDDPMAAALAAGLTGAELDAFLASGLTLEEWLASRLAATGTPEGAAQLGLLAAGLLSVVGAWFLIWSARRRETI